MVFRKKLRNYPKNSLIQKYQMKVFKTYVILVLFKLNVSFVKYEEQKGLRR